MIIKSVIHEIFNRVIWLKLDHEPNCVIVLIGVYNSNVTVISAVLKFGNIKIIYSF